jgi:putative transposase
MPQSHFALYAHIIFSTRYRQALITPEIRSRLHAYLAGILRNQGCHSARVGGPADYIHICCQQPKLVAPADLIEIVKKDSSRWMKTHGGIWANFFWQTGYGAFSVNPEQEPTLLTYIDRQEEHHRQETFLEEVQRILAALGYDYHEHAWIE